MTESREVLIEAMRAALMNQEQLGSDVRSNMAVALDALLTHPGAVLRELENAPCQTCDGTGRRPLTGSILTKLCSACGGSGILGRDGVDKLRGFEQVGWVKPKGRRIGDLRDPEDRAVFVVSVDAPTLFCIYCRRWVDRLVVDDDLFPPNAMCEDCHQKTPPVPEPSEGPSEVSDLGRRAMSGELMQREWQDALLALWGELDAEQVGRLREDFPDLMDFCSHLHHRIEHEALMVSGNAWAVPEPSEGEK